MTVASPGVVLFDAKLKEERQYWVERLAGTPGSADSWLDGGRARSASADGRQEVAFDLPAEAVERLEALTHGSPFLTFVALFAATAACLRRYTGSDTVVLGSPALRELERANALPIRVEVEGREGLRPLLAAARAALLAAYDRQRYPINYLTRDLGLASDADLFSLAVGLDGLHGELPPLAAAALLRFARQEGRITGRLAIDPRQLRRERAEAMAGHVGRLLAQALARPDQPLSEIDFLAPEEREQLVLRLNETDIDDRDERSEPLLHRPFEEQAALRPEAEALLFAEERLTYGELAVRANRLAHHLRRAGVAPEVPVGVFLERSTELLVALLAILKAGGYYLPLDPDHPPARLARLLEEAVPPVVVTSSRLADRFAELRPAPAMRRVLADRFPAGPPEDDLDPASSALPDGLAYVIHTSGSTGRPQGAMNTHRAIRNRLLWMQEAFPLAPGDRVLHKTPFSFDVSVWELFWPLSVGAALVVALPGGHRDSAYLLRILVEREIRVVHFVPSMLQAFLEEPGVERAGRTLERIVASGEALSPELRDRCLSRLACELHNLYGPTEAAVDVTSWDCRRPSAARTVPIGRPIANLRLYLVDRDFQPVPGGVEGELCLGGVGLARGYLGMPEATAARFVPDPFSGRRGERLYRTGDLCRLLLPGGEVEFLGRLDHQVKIRGYRVELGEIEAVVRRNEAVREAVVLAREDGRGEVRLVAYVVPVPADPAPGPPAEAAEGEGAAEARRRRDDLVAALRAHAASALPEPMIPAVFVLLDALPLNANGKVDRRALPAPEDLAARGDRPFRAPRTPVEETLAALWAELLRAERIGIDDDFFELGGHSLLLTQLASRIRKTFHVDLPLRMLFDVPTVETMATAIVGRQVEAAPADDVAEMMRRLEGLTPEEIERLLAEGGRA